jgi:hypothetical protein
MKPMEIVPDRASAVIAAVLVAVLVLALALLEAMGAERALTRPEPAPRFRAIDRAASPSDGVLRSDPTTAR